LGKWRIKESIKNNLAHLKLAINTGIEALEQMNHEVVIMKKPWI